MNVPKFISPWLLLFIVLELQSQPNLYRTYQQTPPPVNSMYLVCGIQKPVRTADKGYMFSYNPWSPNLHAPHPYDRYVFKTDSNFVPEWKKTFLCEPLPLSTGGIILYYSHGIMEVNGWHSTRIEKVAASGTVLWSLEISGNVRINGGVAYNDRVRLVGARMFSIPGPIPAFNYYPFTLELDTGGTVISQQMFSNTSTGSCEFNNIVRAPSGDFYVTGTSTNFCLSKFDSNFNFLWAKSSSNTLQPFLLNDIIIMQSGSIMASGQIRGLYPYNDPLMGYLARFDAQGSILAQKFFERRFGMSGLTKKNNNAYVFGVNSRYNDSLYLAETDTMLNLTWFRLVSRGIGIGAPVIKDSSLFVPVFKKEPRLFASDMAGNTCGVLASTYSLLPASASVAPVTLITSSYSLTTQSASPVPVSPQPYTDSCFCAPSITGPKAACLNSAIQLTGTGTGTLSWHPALTSTTTLGTGHHFISASSGGTVFTVFLQDGVCPPGVHRASHSWTMAPPASVSISPSSATVCAGTSVVFSGQGAQTYTWNSMFVTSSLTTSLAGSYHVVGQDAAGCTGTATASLHVLPVPAVTVNSGSICSGQNFTITPAGAGNYTVSGNGSFIVSPTITSSYSVLGMAPNGCVNNPAAVATVSVVVPVPPSITSSKPFACSNETVTLTATGSTGYTWTNTQTGPTFTLQAQQDTAISVQAVSAEGCTCTATFVQYVDMCTDLVQKNIVKVEIYPNPVEDILYVQSPVGRYQRMYIYDGSGKQMLSVESLRWQNDVSFLSPGFYYLVLTGEQGRQAMKFVVR